MVNKAWVATEVLVKSMFRHQFISFSHWAAIRKHKFPGGKTSDSKDLVESYLD